MDGEQDPTNGEDARHLWRVMAWCGEFGRNAGVSPAESAALERAAVLRYRTKLSVDYAALAKLAADIGIEAPREPEEETERRAEEILRALFGSRDVDESARRLARMLELCQDLDTACELDARVSSDPELSDLDLLTNEVSTHLKSVTDEELASAGRELPVFPDVAQRALEMLASGHASLTDLGSLIAGDQGLAVHLVREANSALYGARYRVATIAEALSRIGLERGRRVVSAAALRGMFRLRQSHGLWNHSLDVAQVALRLASAAGVDRDTAFLAGLVHDIGKLVCLELPAGAIGRYERLTRAGCPDVVVERVVFGEDHASVGGRLLREWRFSGTTIGAVESHHEPERGGSALGAVLYLAELVAGRDEGLPSEWRKRLALGTAGLEEKTLWEKDGRGVESEGSVLRFEAVA